MDMKADGKQKLIRVFSGVADGALLLAGCIAAIATNAAGATYSAFYLQSVEILSIIEVCFFALFVIIEIVSAFTISDSTWHTAFVALALLGFHLTGADFLRTMFGAEQSIFSQIGDILRFFFFEGAAIALFLFWNYTYGLGIPRRVLFLGAGWALIALAAYASLYFFGYRMIGFGISVAGLIAATAYLYRRMGARQTDKTFIASEALFYALAGSAITAEACVLQNRSPIGFTAFHAIPLVLVFLSVYAAFAMRTDREALKASEYKLQYERIKARALKEQIKPHFIFNVLAAIQSLYRNNVDDGDRAVTLLARHLRTNIEASDTDFIPFEKELDNVQVLVDLENMRLGKKVNIIYDIDCTDFEIPVLSLQPYIENAIKYSRVNEKEDGFICISTRREEEGILVAVTDNGVGFDPSAVSASSCGIRNSSERFSMLMGVTPEIESEPGRGTSVRIFIKNSTPPPQIPKD